MVMEIRSAFWVPPVTRHPYLYQGIRLVLDLLAAAIVLLIFNRFWLIFIAIMDCLLSLVIAAYNQYFHQALSAYYAIKTVKEGLRVTGFAAQVIPPFVWALLICASLTSSITYAGRSPSNGAAAALLPPSHSLRRERVNEIIKCS